MNEYTNDIRNNYIIGGDLIAKNGEINENWSNYMINKNNARNIIELPIIANKNETNATTCDYAIYADGENIDFNNINDIPIKFRTYNKNIDEYKLKIQWGRKNIC